MMHRFFLVWACALFAIQCSSAQKVVKDSIRGLYVFADEQGEIIKELGSWDSVPMPFRSSSQDFAHVQKKGRDYLLERKGTQYRLALRVEDIDKRTEAIALINQALEEFPKAIFRAEGLKILNLQNNKLSSLPAELGQLQKLEKLSLSRNKLSSLTAELGQLQSLEWLNLSDNPLPKAELERIKTLLPDISISN